MKGRKNFLVAEKISIKKKSSTLEQARKMVFSGIFRADYYRLKNKKVKEFALRGEPRTPYFRIEAA